MKKTISTDTAFIPLGKTAPASISLTAARLSIGAAATFVILLAALHAIKPELDPSWRFISEYAIGDFGWLMMLAFLSLAVSYVSLFIAIKSQVLSIGGKIGLALLLLSALGMIIAGIFTTDPITTRRDAMTTTGQLHEVGALLDVTPFAALLINWSLARRNPTWSIARRALALTAGLPLLGLVMFIASTVFMLPSDGKFSPDVLVGWPNRFLIVTYCVWLITVAWQAIQVRLYTVN